MAEARAARARAEELAAQVAMAEARAEQARRKILASTDPAAPPSPVSLPAPPSGSVFVSDLPGGALAVPSAPPPADQPGTLAMATTPSPTTPAATSMVSQEEANRVKQSSERAMQEFYAEVQA